MDTQRNTLGDLNDILFNAIDRLDAAKPSDGETMKQEIERARAIQGLAGTVIANGRLVLDAARSANGCYDNVKVPTMLQGGN